MFGQQTIIKYTNDDHSYHGKSRNDFSSYSHIINDITIKSDSIFEFDSRPIYSCSTWKNFKGTWETKNDTIIFRDTYELEEEKVTVFYNRTSDNFYFLQFSTDKKSPLKNREILIDVEYDFDSKIEDIRKNYTIDSNDAVKILFRDIPNQDKVANLRIEYQFTPSDRRYQYITENNTINVKKGSVPNFIEIEFIEGPKKAIVSRTTKFLKKDNRLFFISSFRTRTEMKDYNRTIEFEPMYTLEKL